MAVKEPWAALGISRATYFRQKKLGILGDASKRNQESNHKALFFQWIEGGVVKPWSENYEFTQTLQMKLYFKKFGNISAKDLEQWLLELPPDRFSTRKDRHSAVSSFAKFLALRGYLP